MIHYKNEESVKQNFVIPPFIEKLIWITDHLLLQMLIDYVPS